MRAELHERYAGWLEAVGRRAERRARGDDRVPPRAGLPALRRARPVRRAHAPACAPRLHSGSPPPDRLPSTATHRSQAACSNVRSRCCRPMTLPASSCCPSWPRRSSWPGKLARAKAVCEEAIEAAHREGDRPNRGPRARRSRSTGSSRPTRRARRIAPNAWQKTRWAVFEEAGDELGLARAWSLLGATGLGARTNDRAQRCVERGTRARTARAARAPAGADARLCECAHSLWGPAHVDEVTTRGEETLAWARANGNRYLEANTLGYSLGLSDAMRGRIDEGPPADRRGESDPRRPRPAAMARPRSVTQRPTSSGSQATRLLPSTSFAGLRAARRRTTDGRATPQCSASRPCAVPAEPLGAKLRTGAP